MYVILVEAGKWKGADIIGPFKGFGEAQCVLDDVNRDGWGYLMELCSYQEYMINSGRWSWQYCGVDGYDITGHPYAEQDAVEKRLWSQDADLIELWIRPTPGDEWVREGE